MAAKKNVKKTNEEIFETIRKKNTKTSDETQVLSSKIDSSVGCSKNKVWEITTSFEKGSVSIKHMQCPTWNRSGCTEELASPVNLQPRRKCLHVMVNEQIW